MPYCCAFDLVTLVTLWRRAGQRQVEREADDPLAAFFGEQAGLDGDGFARAAGGEIAAADAGVLALGVLAHDDPVQCRRVGLASGLGTPGRKRTGRTLAY